MKHVCILARKRLRYNARIHRQARSLSLAGYKVTVIALAEEGLPSYEETPYCTIHRIELTGTNITLKLLQFIRVPYRLTRKILYRFSGAWHAPAYLNRGLKAFLFIIRITIIRPIRSLIQATRESRNQLFRILYQFQRAFSPPVDLAFGLKALPSILRYRADIYCSHDSYPLVAAYVFAKLHKARLVYDAVEFSPDRNVPKGLISSRLSSLHNKVESRIIRKTDAVFTVGDSMASLIAEYYMIEKPTVILNCPEYMDTVTPKPIINSSGRRVIIYAGSITSNNGLEQLIEAMQYVDNAVTVIVGPSTLSDYEEKLKKLIKELKLETRVYIKEALEQHEVIPSLSSADVGVIPIQKNCLNHIHISPNKLYEYIASRIPVATGDFPTVTPLVRTYKIGEIFDETNPESIGHTLNYVLANKDNYKEALESCAERLCWENEALKLVEVIERELSKGRGSG